MTHPETFSRHEKVGKFLCPHCEKERAINFTQISDEDIKNVTGKPFKIRCRCGRKFVALCEFRRFTRSRVDTQGRVYSPYREGKDYAISIISLSMKDVGFIVEDGHIIHVDDMLNISFQLNNKRQVAVDEAIVVRRVEKNSVGAEFFHHDIYTKLTGEYLPVVVTY